MDHFKKVCSMIDDFIEIDTAEKPANQSVTKLMQLISTMADSRSPMRLQDIAASAEMSQATVLRYLNALIQEGYAYRCELLGRYALTWKVCSLGQKIRSNMSIRTLAGTLLNDLSGKLGLGVSLVVERDMECMYLDCVYEPSLMGPTLQRIGRQTPMHTTSSGKLFLSTYSDSKLDELIKSKSLTRLTKNTIVTKEALVTELNKVREYGYAIDDEECEEGLRCFALPVYDYNEKIAAAISCFASTEKLTFDFIESTVMPALRDTAIEISFRMGSSYLNGVVK